MQENLVLRYKRLKSLRFGNRKKLKPLLDLLLIIIMLPLVESSIKTGKALFLEKPLCISEEELNKLESMAASSDELPIIMVGHNRRFSPHLEQLHRWLLLRKNPLVIQYRVNSDLSLRITGFTQKEKEGVELLVK